MHTMREWLTWLNQWWALILLIMLTALAASQLGFSKGWRQGRSFQEQIDSIGPFDDQGEE